MSDDYVEKDKREAEATKYENMMDIWFERWFIGYSSQQSINVELFKPVLKRAFKAGWLKCEEFYS